MYAKIESDNIIKTGPRPNWRTDEGEPVSDEVLIAHGWLPVIYDVPAYDSLSQRTSLNDQSQWMIEADKVLATYSIDAIPFEEMQQAALSRINNEYSRRVIALAESYPESEQKSWFVQIAEAAIVLGEDDQPTPWIDSAAPARGITRTALASLIQAQDYEYRQYHGHLTGVRQVLRDEILGVADDQYAASSFAMIQWPEGIEL